MQRREKLLHHGIAHNWRLPIACGRSVCLHDKVSLQDCVSSWAAGRWNVLRRTTSIEFGLNSRKLLKKHLDWKAPIPVMSSPYAAFSKAKPWATVLATSVKMVKRLRLPFSPSHSLPSLLHSSSLIIGLDAACG